MKAKLLSKYCNFTVTQMFFNGIFLSGELILLTSKPQAWLPVLTMGLYLSVLGKLFSNLS